MGQASQVVPALFGSLLGIMITALYLDRGVPFLLWFGLGPCLLLVLTFVIGRVLLRARPRKATLLLETGQLVAVVVAAAVTATLLSFTIRNSPGDDASIREKEMFAALAAALGAYGSFVIAQWFDWNPVRLGIKTEFRGKFTTRRDNTEKDAHDAVVVDRGYGSLAGNGVVRGWDWRSRRLRSRHIQLAIDSGYLEPPSSSVSESPPQA